ncbi:MAG: dihydrodipicolinate synthase family protein, partial [Acidimicrobiia bacterium]
MVTIRTEGKVLATSVIPWTEDWSFDEQRFRSQVRAQLAAGLTDLYIFGTAGEGHAVSDSQFATVTKAFVEEMRQGGGQPMVGVVSLSTTTVIERIQTARDLGVLRFQISMPSWAALGDGEVDVFFEDVLGSFRELEFLHYNVARAKRQLTGVEYGRLAARHRNLVATKQSGDSMRQIATSLEEAPQLRHYFVDGGYAYGSLIGDCGLLPSL